MLLPLLLFAFFDAMGKRAGFVCDAVPKCERLRRIFTGDVIVPAVSCGRISPFFLPFPERQQPTAFPYPHPPLLHHFGANNSPGPTTLFLPSVTFSCSIAPAEVSALSTHKGISRISNESSSSCSTRDHASPAYARPGVKPRAPRHRDLPVPGGLSSAHRRGGRGLRHPGV